MKRRILYVIGSLNVGGAERHLSQVAIRLKRRGWEPEVFALSPGGPLTDGIEAAQVPIYGAKLPKWLAAVLRTDRWRARVMLVPAALTLVFIIWRRRPHVMHFFLPAAYIVGGLASMLAFVPARIMSRRSLGVYQLGHPLFARVERRLHPRMTLVCGNSQAVVADLRQEGVAPAKLRLIYNGIDTEAFSRPVERDQARDTLRIARDATVFVIVANLIPYKGHADLIAAFARIQPELRGPWELLCVGRDDGIAAQLRSQIDAAGLQANIRILGARSDVPDILRVADIGVLCSHEEGFSNAILEGMAAGLPMVVTDVGGNAEAVVDGQTGFVVPPHDAPALGDALLRMANSPNRVEMGEAGRRRVRAQFSMEACIDGYEKLYLETGARKP
ncbi:glycosyltransferase [Devosia sp. LjRoot16]|uniref:glycosyltransferase n=1 Tax=Devosia sp. LjRoot16 TaxID=3342271 RepID=UPI003ECE65B9